MPSRTLAKRVTYRLTQHLAQLVGTIFFRMRVKGRHFFPVTGPALICSNHQSYFDPVLVGLASSRHMNYLARKTLFDNRIFGRFIEWYDAIPIDRDGFGIAGIKETLRRLKREEMVLIFPEGTRTRDGEVSPLKPGFCTLARRSQAPLVPVAVDGAYQAWPRGQRFPQLRVIHVVIGPPIMPEDYADLDDQTVTDELERRIRACHQQARQGRQ